MKNCSDIIGNRTRDLSVCTCNVSTNCATGCPAFYTVGCIIISVYEGRQGNWSWRQQLSPKRWYNLPDPTASHPRKPQLQTPEPQISFYHAVFYIPHETVSNKHTQWKVLKSVGKGRQLHIGASCCTTFHSLQFHTHTHTHTHAHTCRDNVRRKSLCDPTTSISYTDQLSRTAGGLDTGQNHSISSPVYHDPTLMNTLQFLGQSTPPVCNHLIQYFRYQVFHTGDRNRTDGLTLCNKCWGAWKTDRRILAGQETARIYYTERFTTVCTTARSKPDECSLHPPSNPHLSLPKVRSTKFSRQIYLLNAQTLPSSSSSGYFETDET